MKNTQRKTMKSYITLKQRITAAVTAVVMLAQICIPTVALATTAWSGNFESRLASELNSPMIELINDLAAPEAYTGAYFIHKSTINHTTLDSFYDEYAKGKPAQKPKLIGDNFVQTRLIRAQYRSLMGRYFFSGVLRAEETEAFETSRLYGNAKTYAEESNLTLGNPLGNASPAQDMIWPELKQINGKSYLVPVVHLSQNTLNNKLSDHLIQFDSNATFAGIQLDFATLITGYNSTITGLEGIINNSGNIQSAGNLTLVTNGTLANMGGTITAEQNVSIFSNDFYNKTLVVPYKDKNGEGTRLGRVASVDTKEGDLYIYANNNITFEGSTASAGGTLKLEANNNINILPLQTGSTSQSQQGHWAVNKSTTDLLMSRLAAEDTLSLIAGGVINITASELVSTNGGIELLAKNGIHILDELEQTTIQKDDRKGKTKGTSSEFRTEAVRAILNAGKGVLLDSEHGDVVLRATQLTSTSGTEVYARNGKVHLLMTKELEEFHLQTTKTGTWTIKTRTEDIVHENNIQNAIVGGLQVQAMYGINVEYTGKEGATLKEQIEEYRKIPEMKWMAELYDQALAEAGPNLNWEELEEIHKELKKTKRNLSPAAMAIIAIAVAIVTAGAGAMLLGVQGTAYAGMANAALTTIATQATQSLAVGDSPGETLKKLGSKESIKNLAVSVATAGAMQNIPDVKIFGAANTAASIANQATQAMVNATVTAGISMAVNGGNSDTFKQMFIQAVAMDAINFVGEKLANKIGDAAKLPKDQRISVGAKYISHAALGCMTGALTSQLNDADKKLGCASGAGGAVIGEYVGSLYANKLDEEMKEWIDESIKEDGERPSFTQQQEKFDYFKAKGVDMARLAAALTAFASGGDVNIAANSGQNAAQNNALHLALILIDYLKLNGDGDILKGLAAVGAREDYLTRMYDALVGQVNEYGQQVYKVVAAGNEEEIKLVGALLTELWKISPLGAAEDAAAKALTAGITVVVESETGVRTTKAWNSLSEQDQNQIKGAARIVEITMDAASRGRLGAVKNMIEMPEIKSGQTNMTEMLENPSHPSWKNVDDSTKKALFDTTPPVSLKSNVVIKDHYEHHNAFVADMKNQLQENGFVVNEKEISFGSSCTIGRCRPDIVAKGPDGKISLVIEVKTGDADFSIRQTEIFPQIANGSAIPKGDVAKQFGLRPDIALKDQGYPNGIPVFEARSPGVDGRGDYSFKKLVFSE
ncbi:MAG: DUF637 domain-containing protein [Cellvibrio sp.]|uniref:DUF637 domain-containing protein n=1 Tax=Cellvibrio sp. TaxID=1965322 RepID=UPI002719C2CE|nr:DUF637 domain-containing protein [Cellvibrio sp.]